MIIKNSNILLFVSFYPKQTLFMWMQQANAIMSIFS